MLSKNYNNIHSTLNLLTVNFYLPTLTFDKYINELW